MKIKSGFVLHTIGNENVVVSIEDRTKDFRGMIRLNPTGAFLWRLMETDCTEQSLADALVEEYGITEGLAKEAVSAFLGKFAGMDVIEQ